MSEYRIGHGIDIHQLEVGRRCVLGGIEIASPVGPVGHSDADVVTHALMDALLGAVGESDIGTHFPNTDPKYSDADSVELLGEVYRIVRQKGFTLVNCDLSVLTEHPKLKPHIESMKKRLAEVLQVDVERIGIKATTAERLGAIGREEGIFASATVLLTKGGSQT